MAFGIKADFNETEKKDFDKIETPETQKQQPIKEEVKKEEVQTEQKAPEKIEDVFEKLETKKEDTPEKKEPVSLNDEAVLNYINTKNDTKFESLEEYQKSLTKEVEKPIEKIVNPYQDIMDETDEAYFKFKRETGNGRKEWDFVQKDIKSLEPLDLAIEKIKNDSGLSLNKSEAKEYLEKKLNIDLDGELSASDKIELNSYVKPYREELLSQQEKYLKPLEEALKNKKQETNVVTLPSGEQIPKEQYQAHIDKVKREYIENIEKGVSSATSSEFNIEFDDNGEKRTINFKYDFSKEDKQSMLSDAKDIDAMLEKRYSSKDGFDHSRLAKGLWFGDENNLQKVIGAAVQQARAEVIAEMASQDNNENFQRKPLDTLKQKEDGYGSLDQGIAGTKKGFGVQVNV